MLKKKSRKKIPPPIPFEERIALETAFERDQALMEGAFDKETPILYAVPSLRIVEDDTFRNFLRRQKKENKELMRIDLDSMLSVHARSLPANTGFDRQFHNV